MWSREQRQHLLEAAELAAQDDDGRTVDRSAQRKLFAESLVEHAHAVIGESPDAIARIIESWASETARRDVTSHRDKHRVRLSDGGRLFYRPWDVLTVADNLDVYFVRATTTDLQAVALIHQEGAAKQQAYALAWLRLAERMNSIGADARVGDHLPSLADLLDETEIEVSP